MKNQRNHSDSLSAQAFGYFRMYCIDAMGTQKKIAKTIIDVYAIWDAFEVANGI
jgi:hypothetical protein